MCWHCNSWVPVNDLARLLLRLDPETGYWLHGLWMDALTTACVEVLTGREEGELGDDAALAHAWLRETNPGYRDIALGHLGPLPAGADPYLHCACEIRTSWVEGHMRLYDPRGNCPLPVSERQLWGLSPRGDWEGLQPLKEGRFLLPLEECSDAGRYDPRQFYDNDV